MFEFRVTKYDPTLRDARGVFTGTEWTSFRDVGTSFAGTTLTADDYDRVEDAYATTATSFMGEAGISALTVVGLENHAGILLPFSEGTALGIVEVETVLRHVLREEFWCRLETRGGFIHVGWDYYMYVGVQHPCPTTQAAARQLGLFVEPFLSPYHEHGTA